MTADQVINTLRDKPYIRSGKVQCYVTPYMTLPEEDSIIIKIIHQEKALNTKISKITYMDEIGLISHLERMEYNFLSCTGIDLNKINIGQECMKDLIYNENVNAMVRWIRDTDPSIKEAILNKTANDDIGRIKYMMRDPEILQVVQNICKPHKDIIVPDTELEDIDRTWGPTNLGLPRFRLGLEFAKDIYDKLFKSETKANPNQDKLDSLLQYFRKDHLPEHLQLISEKISELAEFLLEELPLYHPETEMGFRKLLEAQDCFVRSKRSLEN